MLAPQNHFLSSTRIRHLLCAALRMIHFQCFEIWIVIVLSLNTLYYLHDIYVSTFSGNSHELLIRTRLNVNGTMMSVAAVAAVMGQFWHFKTNNSVHKYSTLKTIFVSSMDWRVLCGMWFSCELWKMVWWYNLFRWWKLANYYLNWISYEIHYIHLIHKYYHMANGEGELMLEAVNQSQCSSYELKWKI